MLSKVRLTEILSTIGTDVSLNADNTCSFIVKDNYKINIMYDDETQNTCVYGIIGELPKNFEQQLIICKKIIAANFLWDATLGNTLSMDPESDSIIYQTYYFDDDEADFKTFLVDFAEKLEFWYEQYKEIVTNSEILLTEDPKEETDTSLPNNELV